jgi:hypothetical protein
MSYAPPGSGVLPAREFSGTVHGILKPDIPVLLSPRYVAALLSAGVADLAELGADILKPGFLRLG